MRKMRNLVLAAALVCFGGSLPSLALNITWTNVSPSTVVSGAWSNADNWDVRIPESGDTVRLTNDVNSYIVGVESAPAVFNALYMSNTGSSITDLRIGADMDFSPTLTYGFTLSAKNANTVMDIQSGITRLAWSIGADGGFRIRNGANLITRASNKTSGGLGPLANMTVESGGRWDVAGGLYCRNGGRITVEPGGVWDINTSSRMAGANVGSSGLVITNRGTFTIRYSMEFGFNCGYANIIYQDDGTLSYLNTTQPLYIAIVGSSPQATRASLRVRGGLADVRGPLNVGVNGETWGRATISEGLLAISDGEYRHTTPLIKVGGWVNAIQADKTMDLNAQNTVRGEIAVSGGKFSTRGNILVANGPSKGFVTVTGGEFYVTNATGTASLLLGGMDDPTLLRTGLATLTVATNGYVEVDRLYATNQVSGANYSIVKLHGGELAARAILADNGALFEVGDGTNAATLSLLGTEHTFNDGLAIHSNAVLEVQGVDTTGAATLIGNVTFEAGSTMRIDMAAKADHDTLHVDGSVALGGTLDLNLLGGFTPPRGSSWTIITTTGGVTGDFDETPLGLTTQIVGNDVILEVYRGTVISVR